MGYRAFTREAPGAVNYNASPDNFVFDNQVLAQIWYAGFEKPGIPALQNISTTFSLQISL